MAGYKVKIMDMGGNFVASISTEAESPEKAISNVRKHWALTKFRGSRVRGGTGLGLSIVKHVLKRHDSGLAVRSAFGQGSRFYCVFPPHPVILMAVLLTRFISKGVLMGAVKG